MPDFPAARLHKATAQLTNRRLRARRADSQRDLIEINALRSSCFSASAEHLADAFDLVCDHVMIEEATTGRLVGAFRMRTVRGDELQKTYTGGYYDLTGLSRRSGLMTEIGRFCVIPGPADPDILRLSWSVITQHVTGRGIGFLFGCSSFQGTDPQPYARGFELLRTRYLAPADWLPETKAAEIWRFPSVEKPSSCTWDARPELPPLLRSYVTMGGRVSDHAVVDRELDTLHVFTGVDVDAIPASRKRLLRALL